MMRAWTIACVLACVWVAMGCAGMYPAQWRQNYMVEQVESAGYIPMRMGSGRKAQTSWWGADGRWRLDGMGGTRILVAGETKPDWIPEDEIDR
jgi:hypothetical protein